MIPASISSPGAHRFRFGLFTLLFALIALAYLQAQRSPEITAASILEGHVEAMGGRAAFDKIKTRIYRGTLLRTSIDEMSLLTLYETNSNCRLHQTRSEILGVLEEGSAGSTAWTHSLMAGPRLKKGAELAYSLRLAPIDAPSRWRDNFAKIEYLGKRELDGKACHVVKAEPHGSGTETHYYEVATGLLLRVELILYTEGNPVPSVITYKNYREVDGILLPHTIREKLDTLDEIVTSIEEIDHQTPISPSVFEPPAEVQALLDLK